MACEKQCPGNIKTGDVDFTVTSNSLLPKKEPLKTLIFENSAGENLTLPGSDQTWKKIDKIYVEALCVQGELNQDIQHKYFFAPKYLAYYYFKFVHLLQY